MVVYYSLIGNKALTGKDGRCYVVGNDIIKIYKCPKMKYEVEDLSNYMSSLISFPKYYIKVRDEIVGELMPFFEGILFHKIILQYLPKRHYLYLSLRSLMRLYEYDHNLFL